MINLIEILGNDVNLLNNLKTNKSEYYLSFPIRKSTGNLRWIDAPIPELKQIQQKLLHQFLYKFKPHPAAMGFIKGLGVKDGADKHLGNKVILTLDISNFFGSIKTNSIYRLFHYLLKRAETLNLIEIQNEQNILNYLVEVTTYKGQLPQGAPTSPALANLFSNFIDKKLQTLADKNQLVYTRYADDITFSHKNKSFDIGKLIPDVTTIIEGHGLKVNEKKTRVVRPHKRMVVTGVVINDKLGVPKYKQRNFRAQLHNLIKNNVSISLEEYQQLRGYTEWINHLNSKKGEFFLQQLGKIPQKSY